MKAGFIGLGTMGAFVAANLQGGGREPPRRRCGENRDSRVPMGLQPERAGAAIGCDPAGVQAVLGADTPAR